MSPSTSWPATSNFNYTCPSQCPRMSTKRCSRSHLLAAECSIQSIQYEILLCSSYYVYIHCFFMHLVVLPMCFFFFSSLKEFVVVVSSREPRWHFNQRIRQELNEPRHIGVVNLEKNSLLNHDRLSYNYLIGTHSVRLISHISCWNSKYADQIRLGFIFVPFVTRISKSE